MIKKRLITKLLVTTLAASTVFGLPAQGMNGVYAAEGGADVVANESKLEQWIAQFEEYKQELLEVVAVYTISAVAKIREYAEEAAVKIKDATYNAKQTLEENKQKIKDFVDHLLKNVQAALWEDTFNRYKDELIEIIDVYKNSIDSDIKDLALIAEAKIKALSYNTKLTLEENLEKAKALVDKLTEDIEALKKKSGKKETTTKKSILEVLSEQFEKYRQDLIKIIDEYKKSSDAKIKEKADEAAKKIKEFKYDFNQSLLENEARLKAVIDQLIKDIDVFHLITPKEKATTYSLEWVKGKWYNKDGTQTYKPTGRWYKNDKGWWYQDTSGWYPKSMWQKINGVWYYFKYTGYMAESEFCNGYWLDRSGAWTYTFRASWHRNDFGWWYGDASGWYAKDATYIIDGYKCTFDKNGYLIEN